MRMQVAIGLGFHLLKHMHELSWSITERNNAKPNQIVIAFHVFAVYPFGRWIGVPLSCESCCFSVPQIVDCELSLMLAMVIVEYSQSAQIPL